MVRRNRTSCPVDDFRSMLTARIQEKFVDKPLALRYFKHLKVGYLKDSVFYRDYTVIKSKKGNKIHADVGDITGVDLYGY